MVADAETISKREVTKYTVFWMYTYYNCGVIIKTEPCEGPGMKEKKLGPFTYVFRFYWVSKMWTNKIEAHYIFSYK